MNKISENSRIVITNSIKSFLIKGISLIVGLLTTPAYLEYFDNNIILGAWFSILSVLMWILNCDLGIGNGLRNKLVYCINDNNRTEAKVYISSSYLFLSIIGTVIMLIVAIAGRFIPWNIVFNISSSVISERDLQKAIFILIAAIVLQLVLRLITSILYALQEAFIPGLLNLVTNVILLLYVSLSNHFSLNGNFIYLSIVYLFAVNAPLITATVLVFIKKLSYAIPSTRFFNMHYATEILKVGGAFLLLQFVSMIVDNTKSYLIGLFIGNASVVEYQIYYKILNLPLTVVLIVTTAIWSTITKARAEQDWIWLNNNYKKSLLFVVLVTASEFVIIIPLQHIFDLWLGIHTIGVDLKIAAIIAAMESIMAWRSIVAGFANGLCELKIQAIYMTIGAVFNIPLAFIITKITGSYIGVIIANIISVLPYCIIQTVWLFSFIKSQQHEKLNDNNE